MSDKAFIDFGEVAAELDSSASFGRMIGDVEIILRLSTPSNNAAVGALWSIETTGVGSAVSLDGIHTLYSTIRTASARKEPNLADRAGLKLRPPGPPWISVWRPREEVPSLLVTALIRLSGPSDRLDGIAEATISAGKFVRNPTRSLASVVSGDLIAEMAIWWVRDLPAATTFTAQGESELRWHCSG